MSKARARALRRNATDAERVLWGSLRALRQEGWHFRRQVRIGAYYADFACHHARLVIELDGEQHGVGTAPLYDRRRDAVIRSHGYTVLRFPNGEVFQNIEGVGRAIFDALNRRPRTPNRDRHLPINIKSKNEI